MRRAKLSRGIRVICLATEAGGCVTVYSARITGTEAWRPRGITLTEQKKDCGELTMKTVAWLPRDITKAERKLANGKHGMTKGNANSNKGYSQRRCYENF